MLMKNVFYLLSLLFVAAVTSVQAQTDLKKTEKGAFYQIYTPNTGDKIKLNDVITFQFTQKTDKDSVLFSTYKAGHPVQVQVQPSQNVGDLMDIFPLLAAKDSAIVKVPTDSIFKGHEEARPPFFPKGSFLTFILKIDKVQSLEDAIAERNAGIEKQKQAEVSDINNYISTNKLSPVTTASGLKYVITQPSALRKPIAGDTILVNYAGTLINGKLFDTSIQSVAKAGGLDQPGRPYEPISIILGETPLVAGWTEALALLPQGSKAKLIIPSNLGYADKGQGEIPPYSPLLFDMEIVKVTPGKHIAPAVAKKPGVKHPVKKGTGKKTPVSKKKN